MKDLSEAIRHCEEVAKENKTDADLIWIKGNKPDMLGRTYEGCLKCAKEHRQLAEWLKELKARREAMQKLKEQIATFKKPMAEKYEKLEGNKNYLTGYLSALSVVEGMIAEVENNR